MKTIAKIKKMDKEILNKTELFNLDETLSILFLELNQILSENTNQMMQPKLIILDCPDIEKLNITSRDFATPYSNIEEQIAGNLYSWIHQSYSVLWQVNSEKNEIFIFNKTIQKLGLRFATLLKMQKETAIHSVYKMSISLALSEIVWGKYYKDKLVLNNTVRNCELKREFIFGFSNSVFEKELHTLKVLERFVKMFRKDWNKLN
jgi:hypothetical protein